MCVLSIGPLPPKIRFCTLSVMNVKTALYCETLRVQQAQTFNFNNDKKHIFSDWKGVFELIHVRHSRLFFLPCLR